MKQEMRIPQHRLFDSDRPLTLAPDGNEGKDKTRVNSLAPSEGGSDQRSGEGPRAAVQNLGGKTSPNRAWRGYVTRKLTRALLLSCVLWHAACSASQQLSRNKAREKIQELGLVQFADKEIQVKQIVQSGDNQAVAEADLSMAFRLSKAKGGDWQVNAFRLGDRNWLDIKTFASALNEVRVRETRESLTELLNGMKLFKQKNAKFPQASNIVELTDILVPNFMTQVIRYDGWNRELIFNFTSPDSFQLISLGADGIRGTADDIVVSP
jgi:hypothetical protein